MMPTRNCRQSLLLFLAFVVTIPSSEAFVLPQVLQKPFYQQRYDSSLKQADPKELPPWDKNNDSGYIQPWEDSWWRSEMPDSLRQYKSKYFKKFGFGTKNGDDINIFILGTCHVSQGSSNDTETLLEFVKPDMIFTELCIQRYPIVLQELAENKTEGDDVANPPEDAQEFPSFAHRTLYESQQISSEIIGGEVGGEFNAAYRYWKEKPRTRLVLGDRPMSLTMARWTEHMGRLERLKLALDNFTWLVPPVGLLMSVFGFKAAVRKWSIPTSWVQWGVTGASVLLGILISRIWEDEQMDEDWLSGMLKNREGDDSKDDEKDFFDGGETGFGPSFDKCFVEERDVYMGCKLFQALGSLTEGDGDEIAGFLPRTYNVVAIVGAAHVPGMSKFFSSLLQTLDPEHHLPPLLESKTIRLSESDKFNLVHGSYIY